MSATEFVDLFNTTYSRKIDLDYYHWRFEREDCNTLIFSVHDEQGLKGCAGVHILGMGDFVVAQIVDAIVAERCRGDGRTFASLNAQVNKCAETFGAKALFMLPNEHGAQAWSADRGWRIVSDMYTYARNTCPHPGPTRIEILPVGKFDTWANAIDAIFKTSHPRLFPAVRGKSYLNWRFDNPMHDYTVMQIYLPQGYRPWGYMVLKVFTDPAAGKSTGDIVDILWASDAPVALMDALYTALDYFHKRGVSRAAMWLQTNTILDQMGYYLGFERIEQKRRFCVKVLDNNYARLNDPASWYLTMADAEIY